MADGSRNNPADVHRTSRTSLQFHCNPLGTTFHIQYRSIQTKVSTVSHTTTQELLKKSPRGVQRGRGFTAPLRFSTASQSKKTRPSAKKVKIKPKTNHTINKEKERKIKKKNKRKNKGEKA
nr:hypothetical protein [uncultured Blautia sp.]